MESSEILGRSTTRLGFGGSLLGSTSSAKSKRLLQAAFDAGIRHFDMAPMYGFGRSESLLREALGSRIHDITVTTKYGLNPPARSSWVAPLHRLASTALSTFPAARARLRARLAAPAIGASQLTAEGAANSLEASLKRLGRQHVDLFLLHEATPERLLDDRLLDTLREAVQRGTIAHFGVGSTRAAASACLSERPQYCPILQFEWSVFATSHPELDRIPHLNHGSLGAARSAFLAWLSAEDRAARWSRTVGADLQNPAVVNDLLLKAALERTPRSIVLFSTRSLSHIERNVGVFQNDALTSPANALRLLIQSDYLPPL